MKLDDFYEKLNKLSLYFFSVYVNSMRNVIETYQIQCCKYTRLNSSKFTKNAKDSFKSRIEKNYLIYIGHIKVRYLYFVF